jgi:hypothetical protein
LDTGYRIARPNDELGEAGIDVQNGTSARWRFLTSFLDEAPPGGY